MPFQFNSIYWLQNAVVAEDLFSSHRIGYWRLIESLIKVGIHFSPTRVQSLFENVDRGRSDNESWQLASWFNVPHVKKRVSVVLNGHVCDVTSKCVLGGLTTVAEGRTLLREDQENHEIIS